MSLYRLARPLLFALDPELSHRLALKLAGLAFLPLGEETSKNPVRAMGLEFPNPVGLAAGLDKDAAHIDALARLGFGFIEVGTVTPRPQPGNDKPRLFRAPEHGALVNRMGFNNRGAHAMAARLHELAWRPGP
ncbi:MAG TPA: quinone-dependent dihydroorotate dehydrogenase, partial [Burkholderiales bacterium]|nr:quinone-dependent dihydroorotate dehydrogenase [Burkholderiales bacterium]